MLFSTERRVCDSITLPLAAVAGINYVVGVLLIGQFTVVSNST